MTPQLASVLMPLIRGMDPERAHDLALRALRFGLAGADRSADDPLLATRALGLDFRNPIGLAAGFDKSAVAVAPLMRLGFGFVEAGSVTPRPQFGNPKPRLFRLVEDRAVINRMGMNNAGLAPFLARLAQLPAARPAVLGVNIAINKDNAAPLRDYPALYAAVAPHAAYVAINVSSPNTPGLRDLQGEAMLRDILAALAETRDGLAGPRPPILVKIAPDLSQGAVEPVVEAVVTQGMQGLIVSNTTIARPAPLRSAQKSQAGGLSGPPLRAPSTEMLKRVARLARGRGLTLIGCGGVGSGADALEKIRAGAALVQLYAAFAYDGPALIPRLKRELAAALRRDGFRHVSEAVGVDAQ
ncbi:quinone-dependent dihydroorotate dehydrogenase [Falsiroseomonas selenitidurans]|uniref:Dihydroorotate dehydrogenase (quinone) n=1 Tax=Falsiroseomonas selenitidurans TaxID=2716335 RepID=A0ABX1E730_9PROT|nr:quinone-dependent dihydroorotate dehydrogenase [Falsiroseomonas selenitidurans]NKC32990.1 quinone-dependent dihydroorotate dehydrogenase [Falsiroseomonas selenitidurans]